MNKQWLLVNFTRFLWDTISTFITDKHSKFHDVYVIKKQNKIKNKETLWGLTIVTQKVTLYKDQCNNLDSNKITMEICPFTMLQRQYCKPW